MSVTKSIKNERERKKYMDWVICMTQMKSQKRSFNFCGLNFLHLADIDKLVALMQSGCVFFSLNTGFPEVMGL